MKKLVFFVFAGLVSFSGLAHAVVDETVTVKSSGTEQPATTITIQAKTADNRPVGHPAVIHVSKSKPVAKEHYHVTEKKKDEDKVAYFDYTVETGGVTTTGRKTREEFIAGGFDLGGGVTLTTEPIGSTLTSVGQPVTSTFIGRWDIPTTSPSGVYFSGAVGGSVLNDFRENVGSSSYLKIPTNAAPYFAGAVGYRWPIGFRTELEIAYDWRNVASPYYGDTSAFSGSVNGLYDFTVANNLTFSVGGGVGGASFEYCTGATAGSCTGRTTAGFMGVAIGEASYQLSQYNAVFVRAEGRFFDFDRMLVKCVSEEVVMAGFRMFVPPPR